MTRRPDRPRQSEGPDYHLGEHLCLDLIQGFLSEEEEQEVFSHLATCPACEKLLQEKAGEGARREATRVLVTKPGGELTLERRGTAARAGKVEAKEHRVFDLLTELPARIMAGFRQPRVQAAWAAAAAVVVLSLVLWHELSGPPGAPHLYTLPSYSFQLQTRETPVGDVSEDLIAGLEAYDKEDFKRAADLLDRAGSSELDQTHEMIRRIYLGSALAWRGRHQDSVEALEGVPFELLPGEWGGEAHWTLYVALRESGRKASADSLLQVLAARGGAFGERARGLLQEQDRD